MFKIILWAIYLISVLGMAAMDLAMLHQARKEIKESGLETVKVPRQMKLASKLIELIFCLLPVGNTLLLLYMFLHFEELVENAVGKVLDRG